MDENTLDQPLISFNITMCNHTFYFNKLNSESNYFLILSLCWMCKSHSLWCHASAMKGKTSTLRTSTYICNITDIIFKTSFRLYQRILYVFLSTLEPWEVWITLLKEINVVLQHKSMKGKSISQPTEIFSNLPIIQCPSDTVLWWITALFWS